MMVVMLSSLFCIKAQAFCGFYVAKANSKLFNKTSQVILVRDGTQSTITMSNDYQGDLKEFAMVVPVPVILNEEDIETVEKSVFDKLDDYSAPRMAMYYDNEPCPQPVNDLVLCDSYSFSLSGTASMSVQGSLTYNWGVTIQAKYQVDEYDILILSATESSGLEKWLITNGYKIPEGAKEVLEPYIKSDMKFFVVKVNMDRLAKMGQKDIKPIRIKFHSDKFMLPIRLGMANANGDQDMIVYTFSKKGRVEATNYRNVKIPTDKDVPSFVQNDFGDFYTKVFKTTHKRHNGNVVFHEYAWDVSARNPVKCDPCNGPPPVNQDLLAAGVEWLDAPDAKVYFTRMHVRYNRQNFPQDLRFQETTNTDRFQGRYVIHTPASGPFGCEDGQKYCLDLRERRKNEVLEYGLLTGDDISQHYDYITEYDKYVSKKYKGQLTPIVLPQINDDKNLPGIEAAPQTGGDLFVIFLVLLICALLLVPGRFGSRKKIPA